MLSWGTECAVLFWVGLPGVAWEPWRNSSSAVMLWGGVWGLKVVFGWFCGALRLLSLVGWVAAIVLSWGNDCAAI